MNVAEKEIEDTVSSMCHELESLWMCVKDSLAAMKGSPLKQAIYTMLSNGLKEAVMENCRRKLLLIL